MVEMEVMVIVMMLVEMTMEMTIMMMRMMKAPKHLLRVRMKKTQMHREV